MGQAPVQACPENRHFKGLSRGVQLGKTAADKEQRREIRHCEIGNASFSHAIGL